MRTGDRVRIKEQFRGPDGGMANLIGTIVYTDSIRQEYWVRWPPCTGASKVQGHLLERIGILDELALEAESDA